MNRIVKNVASALAAFGAAGFFAAMPAQAKTWRVNSNPEAKAAFSSLVDALASEEVKSGDELLIEPGQYEGTYDITKQGLTITGPGYALAENTDWAETRSAIINYVRIKASNTTLQGLEIPTVELRLDAETNAPLEDCTIQRCKISTITGSPSEKHNHLVIRQNYIANLKSGVGMRESTVANNIFIGSVTLYGVNNTVENNIFPSVNTWNTGSSYSNVLNVSSLTNSVIRNNILIERNGEVHMGKYLMDFNTANNNVITNNVFSGSEESANANYLNNQWVSARMETVFVDDFGFDGYYLRDDSPAKGAATDGGDCGIFGGAHPYVISGRPKSMPHISSAIIPSSPYENGEVIVKLKIEVQND